MGMKRNAAAGAVSALLVIGALAAAPAQAADLGGDCCADLEERVAELEATTARKGNRLMSVTISGRVDQGLLWYDYMGEALEFQSGSAFQTTTGAPTRMRPISTSSITTAGCASTARPACGQARRSASASR